MDYTKKAMDFFKDDIYATETTGIIIEKADLNYAKCSLKIERKHLNANNHVMGGAIFTLADFTFAIAANLGQPLTVSLNSQIQYLNPCKGTLLIAETNCIKSGKSTCIIEVNIIDDLGIHIAKVIITGLRKQA